MFLEAVHCMFERVELDVGMHGRFSSAVLPKAWTDAEASTIHTATTRSAESVSVQLGFSFQTRVLHKAPSWFFEKSFYPWVRPAALAAPSTRDAASTLE